MAAWSEEEDLFLYQFAGRGEDALLRAARGLGRTVKDCRRRLRRLAGDPPRLACPHPGPGLDWTCLHVIEPALCRSLRAAAPADGPARRT